MVRAAFHKLTATQNAEGIEGYLDAFEYAFASENKDVTNIAVSGPYGSGKSSVVETLKRHNSFRDLRFLTISLTPFSDGSGGGCSGSSGLGLGREIEGQILDQLIHQVNPKSIPKSRFKGTSRTTIPYRMCIVVVLAILAAALAVGLDKTIFTNGSIGDPVVVRTAAWLIVLAILLVGVWRLLSRRGISHFVRKLSFQGNEIEIFDRQSDSMFNKHMDDILYILDNSGYDVVVFEDLDRFPCRNVFEKLREINQLVNRNRKGGQKGCRNTVKPLRFLYLVSDDLFGATERTKFFDFIIPVRPYVDSLSSAGKLSAVLAESDIGFERPIVDDVALFLDDARLLYNVLNEFLVFRRLAGAPEGEAGGVDNSEASSGKGQIEVSVSNSGTDIGAGSRNQQSFKTGLWEPVDDEKLLALVVYKNVFPHDFCLLQRRRGCLHELLGRHDVLVKEVASKVGALPDMSIDETGATALQLSSELLEVDSLSLAELYQALTEQGATPYELKEIDDSQEDNRGLSKEHVAAMLSDPRFGLVKVLLANGYIDESYEHYMAVFHPGALSESDEFFLKHVAAVGSALFNHKLDDPEGVLKRLSAFRFGQPATLNLQLARALLESKDGDKMRHFALQLAQGKDVHAKFLVDFVLSESYDKSIFSLLADTWPKMPDEVFSSKAVTSERLHHFAQALLADGGLSAERQDGSGSFIEFVNKDTMILHVDDEGLATAMCAGVRALEELQIPADALEKPANAVLRHAVYEYDRYAADCEAVCVMLREECGCAEAGSENLFQLAFSHQGEPVFDFVKKHMPALLRMCLASPGFVLEGGHEPINWVLNSGFDWEDMIEGIAAAIPEDTLPDITAVEEKALWKPLFRHGCVSNSFANVMSYLDYCKGVFDETLSSFVNKYGCRIVSGAELPNCFSSADDFVKAVVTASGLEVRRAANLLIDYGISIPDFAFSDVDKALVRELVERGVLAGTPNNLSRLRSGYPDLVAGFLISNIVEVVRGLEKGNLSLNSGEMGMLLESRQLGSDDKVALVRCAGLNLGVSEKYSDEVNVAILEGCFDTEKLDELTAFRADASVGVQSAIDSYLCERAVSGSSLPTELPLASCRAIVSQEDLPSEQKRYILARHLAEYSRYEVSGLLSLLGDKELAQRVSSESGHGVIALDKGVRELIDALRICGYCGADVPNGNLTDVYSVGMKEPPPDFGSEDAI